MPKKSNREYQLKYLATPAGKEAQARAVRKMDKKRAVGTLPLLRIEKELIKEFRELAVGKNDNERLKWLVGEIKELTKKLG